MTRKTHQNIRTLAVPLHLGVGGNHGSKEAGLALVALEAAFAVAGSHLDLSVW